MTDWFMMQEDRSKKTTAISSHLTSFNELQISIEFWNLNHIFVRPEAALNHNRCDQVANGAVIGLTGEIVHFSSIAAIGKFLIVPSGHNLLLSIPTLVESGFKLSFQPTLNGSRNHSISTMILRVITNYNLL